MSAQLELLGSLRIQRIVSAIVDPRNLPQQLVWSSRIPTVAATDEEIIARYEVTPLIADLIADDAKANVYSMGRPVYEVNKIPNIKIGMGLTQADINLIDKLSRGYAAPDELGIFNDRQERFLGYVGLGVAQRAEQLRLLMLCDGVGYDQYNRSGIILPTTMSWGMFSDLKLTSAIAWDSTTGTPVADILNTQLIGRVRYGVNLNRVTMSTQAFRYMVATTEFQNKARAFIPAQLTFTNLQTLAIGQMQSLAASVLGGMNVELYDARFWAQATDTAALTSAPFLPVVNVLLTSTENDGNTQAYDFANAPITEATVARVAGGNIIGGGSIPSYGPAAYVTTTTVDMNSPGLTYWGVQRGMPRKFQKQASAIITCGAFSDTISTSIPTYA